MDTQTNLNFLAQKARDLYASGELALAAEAFQQAAQAFSLSGDELMAAEMKNNECVALLRAGQPAAALDAVSGTTEIFEAAGDASRLGTAYANRASVLQAMKRRQEAIADFVQAAEWLEKAGEGDMRYQVMQLLSSLYLRERKLLNAVMALQSGLAGVKKPTFKQKLMKKLLFFRL
jgi:tetratricopeptide (TPR) repeat protein